MPAALTLILICPWLGSASGTPAHFSTSGGPYPVITTALGMAVPSCWCGLCPPEFEHGDGADSSGLACVFGEAWVALCLLSVDEVACSAGQFAEYARQTAGIRDRKSTRLNSSHSQISYAVFCLKKKNRPAAAPAGDRRLGGPPRGSQAGATRPGARGSAPAHAGPPGLATCSSATLTFACGFPLP